MMWLSTLWIKIRFWLAAAAAVLVAIFAAAVVAYIHGKDTAKAGVRQAKARADAANAARKTYKSATEAAQTVQQQADAQPPPDAVGRDDFDNTF